MSIQGIGERLRTLRKNKEKTQREVANFLKLTPKMVSFYENEERFPPIDMVVKLADYFGVSSDYLLGREDRNITPEAAEMAKELSFLSPEAQEAIMPNIQGMINMAKKMKKD